MKRDILVVGNAHDKHLERFIKGLKFQNLPYSIDIFDISMQYKDIPSASLYNKSYKVNRYFPKFLYKISGLSKIIKYLDLIRSFKEIGNFYNIINIQVVTIQSYLLLKLYKKCCKYIITTPWGSDVYRISDKTQAKYQKIYDASDYICVMPNTKFGDDVIDIFKVPSEKYLELCFGSDILDRVMADATPKEVAKQKLLGIADKFVITCGYNAAPAQNHFEIIKELTKVRAQLPLNTLLVFPVTYAKKEEYLAELDIRLKASGFSYRLFTSYLTDEEMVWLRKSTDLFIHMQKTDAYSSSLHEYLYSKAMVINAKWLSYKELETWGVPYVSSTFDTLSTDCVELANNAKDTTNEELSKYLKVYSWSYQINEWKKAFEKLIK